MSTCPPLAVDRLVGLSGVPKNVVISMEKMQKLALATTPTHLAQLISLIDRLLDRDIFPWLSGTTTPALLPPIEQLR